MNKLFFLYKRWKYKNIDFFSCLKRNRKDYVKIVHWGINSHIASFYEDGSFRKMLNMRKYV